MINLKTFCKSGPGMVNRDHHRRVSAYDRAYLLHCAHTITISATGTINRSNADEREVNTKFPLRRRDVSTQRGAESTMRERQAVSQSGKYVRRPTRAAPTTTLRVPVIRAFSRPAAIHSLAQSLPCLRAAPFFPSRGRPRGARRGPGARSDRSPVLLIASLAANFKLGGGGGGAGQFCSYPSAAVAGRFK